MSRYKLTIAPKKPNTRVGYMDQEFIKEAFFFEKIKLPYIHNSLPFVMSTNTNVMPSHSTNGLFEDSVFLSDTEISNIEPMDETYHVDKIYLDEPFEKALRLLKSKSPRRKYELFQTKLSPEIQSKLLLVTPSELQDFVKLDKLTQINLLSLSINQWQKSLLYLPVFMYYLKKVDDYINRRDAIMTQIREQKRMRATKRAETAATKRQLLWLRRSRKIQQQQQ